MLISRILTYPSRALYIHTKLCIRENFRKEVVNPEPS